MRHQIETDEDVILHDDDAQIFHCPGPLPSDSPSVEPRSHPAPARSSLAIECGLVPLAAITPARPARTAATDVHRLSRIGASLDCRSPELRSSRDGKIPTLQRLDARFRSAATRTSIGRWEALTPDLHFEALRRAWRGRPWRAALAHPVIECGDLGRGQAQAELGAAPDHVLGRAGPLLLDEIAHLGLGQGGAEIPAEVGGRLGACRARGPRACHRRGSSGRHGPRSGTGSCAPGARRAAASRRARTRRRAAAWCPSSPPPGPAGAAGARPAAPARPRPGGGRS